MAIRIRKIDGVLVALCAAKTEAEDGDVYLHDGVHYALSMKFWKDKSEEGAMDAGCAVAAPEWLIMEREENKKND